MIDGGAVARATAARQNAMTVDLDSVAHNVRELKNQAGDDVTFVAALKANAYGFGLNAIAETVLAAGADMLAVASVDDAIAIRGSGISAPIMRVLTPQLVVYASSCLFSRERNLISNALAKFWPR